MALEQAPQILTFVAGADLSASQFKLVETASGVVSIANATTDVVLGSLQNKPSAAGEPAEVCVGGIGKAMAGAAITAGAQVMSDSSGKAVTATATNRACGICPLGAAADGDIVGILFNVIRPLITS